jgi:hypothetical protein
MNRRSAIRNVMAISAGVAFLPACMQDKKTSIALKNISVTQSQEEMLAALSEAILPKTNNFIGAGDLKAHEFVLTMVDDCMSPEDQQKFTTGLKAFDKLSHDRFGQIFKSYTPKQKQSLLTDIENNNDVAPDALNFYRTVKRYTLQCFTSSQQYMTDIKKYKMVPGNKFLGCVEVA